MAIQGAVQNDNAVYSITFFYPGNALIAFRDFFDEMIPERPVYLGSLGENEQLPASAAFKLTNKWECAKNTVDAINFNATKRAASEEGEII